jgi:hypothetical protein
MVGYGDIIRPDIILPLTQPQNPAKDQATMDPYPHVHIYTCRFTHLSTKHPSKILIQFLSIPLGLIWKKKSKEIWQFARAIEENLFVEKY